MLESTNTTLPSVTGLPWRVILPVAVPKGTFGLGVQPPSAAARTPMTTQQGNHGNRGDFLRRSIAPLIELNNSPPRRQELEHKHKKAFHNLPTCRKFSS